MRVVSRWWIFLVTFWLILLPTSPSAKWPVMVRHKRKFFSGPWAGRDVYSAIMNQETTKRSPSLMRERNSINDESWHDIDVREPMTFSVPTPTNIKTRPSTKTGTNNWNKDGLQHSKPSRKITDTNQTRKPKVEGCVCCKAHMRHHKLCRRYFSSRQDSSSTNKHPSVDLPVETRKIYPDFTQDMDSDEDYAVLPSISIEPFEGIVHKDSRDTFVDDLGEPTTTMKTKTILLLGDETVDFLSAGRIRDLCVISTESYSGLTISEVEEHLDEVLQDGIIPDIIILQVGKNDLFPELISGASRVILRLKRLVDVLEAIMVRFPVIFVLSGILPRPEQITSYNAKANLINEEVKVYAEPRGIKFIDHFRDFWRGDRVRIDLFDFDGTLNEEGMELYAASLFSDEYCNSNPTMDEATSDDGETSSRTRSALELEDILPMDRKKYDKNFPPKKEGQATIVYFHVTVLGIDSIDEESMTYVTDIFLAQSWRDYRLRLPENMTEEYRILDVGWMQYIWRPDSFFKNAKKVTFHEMSIPNHYLWLYFDKTLLYMTKLTLQLSCAMKFEAYPHDTQTCNVMIESLSHTTDDLVFKWNLTDALVVNPDIELPQLDIVRNVTEDCTLEYSTGNFTCLAVVFTLRRRLGYHLFHTYIPTTLIVVMSWISFWIRPEAIPARVTLGVTSLLTLATQNTQSQSALPPVSYVKAIDVFMSMCTVFVFLSLMEFAIVNHFMGRTPTTKLMRGFTMTEPSEAKPDEGRKCSCSVQDTVPNKSILCSCGCTSALSIDKFSRFFFPISFGAFIIVYWLLYVSPRLSLT